MADPIPRDAKAGRIVALLLALALGLLAAVAVLSRAEYPEGNYLRQQRSRTLIEENPDLEEAMAAVRRGMTTSDPAVQALGQPDAVLNGDEIDIWAFSKRVQIVRERVWFGLVPAGTAQEGHSALLPLGVKDGAVVHVAHDAHPDAEARADIQKRWSTYHGARPVRFETE